MKISDNKILSKININLRDGTKRFFTGFLLMVIGAVVGHYTIEIWQDTKDLVVSKPYVAVMISRKAIDFEIPKDFMDGFNSVMMMEQKDYFISKDGAEVQIEFEEDFLSAEKSAVIANRLKSDNNCILVIGNANSTLTNVNLDVFLTAKVKLPFLMPIATDDNLLKKTESENYNAVLRMLPNNGRQADEIERLVSEFAPNRRVAIFGDEENQSYSINLSRDISDKIRKKGGKIVIEELIGPTNSIYNSAIKWNDIEDKRPEVLVYVGVSHHGLLLLDQISELNISIPIIFTDGCLVTSLLSNISKYSGRAFILSPAKFEEENLFLPSYKPIGADAYRLASLLIKESDGTREGVLDCIQNHKKKLTFVGKAGRYRFDPYGENEDRGYLVYEMKGGQLVRFIDY